jgi:hypothetical protein
VHNPQLSYLLKSGLRLIDRKHGSHIGYDSNEIFT